MPTIPEEVVMELPVFLPGNNRDWTQVAGRAHITSDGLIVVHLKPEDTERLIKLARDGILYQCAFDYRMTSETVDQMNTQYQKKEG